MEHPFVLQCLEVTISATDHWVTLRHTEDGRLLLRRAGQEQLDELTSLLELRLGSKGSSTCGGLTITSGDSSDIYFTGDGHFGRVPNLAIHDLVNWLTRDHDGEVFIDDDSDEYELHLGAGNNVELRAFDEWLFSLDLVQANDLAIALLEAAKAVYSGEPYTLSYIDDNGVDLTVSTDDTEPNCLLTSDDDVEFELSLTPYSAALMAEGLLALTGEKDN